MKIYIVEGGVGRQIMFSALIPSLSKRDGEKIITMSPYPGIFENNPLVERSLSRNTPFAWDDFIMSDKHEIVYCDPYFHSQFIKRKCHVLEGWAEQLGIEYDPNMKPELYLPHNFERDAEEFWEQNGDFIILQFASGQSPHLYYQNPNAPFKYSGFERNYPKELAFELVRKINEKYLELKLIIYGFPNEGYHFEGTFGLNADTLYYASLLKRSKTYIGINSSLSHMAAAVEKSGIVLWGGTSNEQWGWNSNVHLHGECNFNNSFCSKPYLRDLGDYTSSGRWNCCSPTCMNIDPDEIMLKLDELI